MYKILDKIIYNSRHPNYNGHQETLEEYLNKVRITGGELISILNQEVYSNCIFYLFIFKFKGEK